VPDSRPARRGGALRAAHRRRAGLRRLSPAAAAAVCGGLAAAGLVFSHPGQAAVVLVLTLAYGAASGCLSRLAPFALVAVPVALLVAAVNAVLSPGGLDVLAAVTLGPLRLQVSVQSLWWALASSCRLLSVSLAATLFTVVVGPDEQVGLGARLSPRAGLVFSLAARLLPVLHRDAARIADAQRARGVRLDEGRVWRRAAARLPLLSCLLVQSLERALDVAAAMESRGYGAGARSSWRPLRPRRRADLVAGAAAGAFAGVLVAGLLLGRFRFTFFPLLDPLLPPLSDRWWLAALAALALPLAATAGTRRRRAASAAAPAAAAR
jgi:energy-coupling factor transport system permease protein